MLRVPDPRRRFPAARRAAALLAGALALLPAPARAHLLVTEVAYDPLDETAPTAEFVEVYNPGPDDVALGSLWIANDGEAYPLLVQGPIAGDVTLLDFVHRLPNLTLEPGRTLVICHDSDAFLAEHFAGGPLSAFTNQPGSPLLVEATDDGVGDGVPALMDWGSNPARTLSLANNGECVGLVAWDGASDRVSDHDWVCWRTQEDQPNKDVIYPFGIDGPDPDLDDTLFLDDAGSDALAPVAPEGSSLHRVSMAEPGEPPTGGNGADGHDETAEDWTSWRTGSPTPGLPDGAPLAVELADVASTLELAAPAPSPSRRAVRFAFRLPYAGHAELTVHDVAGRRVATLVAGERAAGDHVALWQPAGEGSGPTGAGIYFARLTFGGQARMRSVVRIR